MAPPLPEYARGPAGRLRTALEHDGVRYPGDLDRMARAVIDSVDRHPAPLRLALGGDAYDLIRTALRQRLAALESQQEVALSTDAEPCSALAKE